MFFQIAADFKKHFLIYLLKESVSKWTDAVQTRVFQGLAV